MSIDSIFRAMYQSVLLFKIVTKIAYNPYITYTVNVY